MLSWAGLLTMTGNTPFLVIRRPEAWYARYVPVSIFVNGVKKGAIPKAPGLLEIELPNPGRFEVYFELEWCRSGIHVTPHIAEGEYHSLRIEHPDRVWFNIYLAIFDSKNFGQLVPERREPEKYR